MFEFEFELDGDFSTLISGNIIGPVLPCASLRRVEPKP